MFLLAFFSPLNKIEMRKRRIKNAHTAIDMHDVIGEESWLQIRIPTVCRHGGCIHVKMSLSWRYFFYFKSKMNVTTVNSCRPLTRKKKKKAFVFNQNKQPSIICRMQRRRKQRSAHQFVAVKMEIETVAVRTVGFTIHTRMIPNQEYNTENMQFFLLFTNKTTKKMPTLDYARA